MNEKKTSTTRYVRLLSYPNACKVIKFILKNDKKDYANVTTGGISTQVSDENWDKVEKYIKSLKVRYEICLDHPEKVTAQIVENLKEKGII